MSKEEAAKLAAKAAAKFDSYSDWLIKGLISFCLMQGVGTLRDVNKSIQDLNVKVAVVIDKTVGHDGAIMRLDNRVLELERIGSAAPSFRTPAGR